MSKVFTTYIAMVESVNNAPTAAERDRLQLKLNGFHEGICEIYGTLYAGSLIMAADTYYIEQGINRPMCGGVFLDWEEPSPEPTP